MEVRGFKCFKPGLINHYGTKFEVGKIYIMPGAIKFGINGNGFHLCKNIEDTFKYYDAMNKDVEICEVIGSGKIAEYEDDYCGYYGMYAVSQLQILRKLSREEIINIGLNLNVVRARRFVELFRLTEEEINKFIEKFKNREFIEIENVIDYYQRGNLDAFTKRM